MGTCLVAIFIGNIWLSLFLIWNVFLFIYNGNVVGSSQLINVLIGCLLFMVSRSFFTDNKFEKFQKYILVILGITLVWTVLQHFGLDPIYGAVSSGGVPFSTPLTDPVGVFGIKMSHGIFMAICLPILASYSVWLALPLLYPIILMQSSGVVLAVAVIIPFYLFFINRRWFWVSLFFLSLGFGLFAYHDAGTDNKTFVSRFPMWHAVLKYSLQNPIGYGPDSFRNMNAHKDFVFMSDSSYNTAIGHQLKDGMLLQFYSPTHDVAKVKAIQDNILQHGMPGGEVNFWDNPHCEYLHLLFEYGIPGILILFGLLREMVIRFAKSAKPRVLIVITSCLLVYAVSSLTQFPLSLARIAYLFPIFLGAFYAETDRKPL